MKRFTPPSMPTCPSRQPRGASAAPALPHKVDDREDLADVDDNNGGVGFDSTTVLLYDGAHQSASKPVDGPSGSSSSGGGSTAALPYIMYEPAYVQQQQQGVLGSVLPDEKAVTAAAWRSGSVFPAPDAPYSQPQPRVQPPPYITPASPRTPFTAGGVGILGPGITEGVSAPPSTSAYAPLSATAESATRAPVKVATSTDVLEVPLHAPRLRVPTNLPLEQTILLDLLATAVVQGGPTTEEEIVKREMGRGNPAFAFLGEKFNHPCMLYYRWRLYSLLQGDTLVSWRTQPFQIEEARRAYVWVPPPPLKVGPECLVGLHQPELLDPAFATGNGGDAVVTVPGVQEEDGTDVIVRSARSRRRHHHRRHHRDHSADSSTNLKRRRCEGGNERGHGNRSRSGSSSSTTTTTTSESDGEQDESKGSGTTAGERGDGDEEKTNAKNHSLGQSPAGTSAMAPSSEATADVAHVRLPPPSAQWISRQCTAHRHVFAILQPHLLETWTALLNPYAIANPATMREGDLGTLSRRWLRRDEISRRMMFAIRHADAIHHLLSVLLDAVVKVAYVATARSRQQPTVSVDPFDSNVYCVEALWYLFLLHDIAMNASNTPESSAASATSVNKNVSSRQPQVLSTASGMSGATSTGPPSVDEEFFASEGSLEALEALYEIFSRQHTATHAGASTPPSPAVAAGATPVTATAVSPSSAPGSTPRPRRRQRHPQRRSPYERCGDALEIILPTLMEACTATALAVSMDKERQRSQAAATTPTAAARVRHFKVLPPHQQQQQSKAKGRPKAAEPESAMASSSTTLSVGGGPSLSLRLDAGSDAAALTKTPSSAGVGADTAASSTASAPAVLLLHWLKAFLIVWMNAEQPRQPPPSPPAGAATAAGVVVPPGTVWPDGGADAADMPDVSLTYHVNPQHASLLGLDAASHQHRNVCHQSPLLSARACAILKDRYSFLF